MCNWGLAIESTYIHTLAIDRLKWSQLVRTWHLLISIVWVVYLREIMELSSDIMRDLIVNFIRVHNLGSVEVLWIIGSEFIAVYILWMRFKILIYA